ncbi:nose resistant to fluoxetine protein 6-like isoform X2 [Dendronephthya gigantea]|uniref:nose resistant to fluoxetine protein 6-like isoform X2 n=1 Tax=Dendronephthya gigantea TaxID=151771 RepID=UPI00106D1E05|nr:nose resistant to fluoxetine protein 6-like isoform X2 [Dendronephthya gigantea]
MKQGCFVFIFPIITLLCAPFGSSAMQESDRNANDTDHIIKQNFKDLAAQEIGYNFLHAYRTALRNGWRESKASTGQNEVVECDEDISKNLMQYIDAVGKPMSGILRGNNFWLGSYGECRDISNAHYCTTNLAIAVAKLGTKLKNLKVIWGLCFPKSCTGQDIAKIMKPILKEVEGLTKGLISAQITGNVDCPAVKPTYTSGVKGTFVLCGILIFLCFIGTVVDLMAETFDISIPADKVNGGDSATNDVIADDVVLLNFSRFSVKCHYILTAFKASFVGQFFQCFSLLQNTTKIMKTDVPPAAIKTINGIRVLSITWVILGHTFSSFGTDRVVNRLEINKDGQLLSVMAIISGTYSVDSFFFLSGLLVAYTCFRKLKDKDKNFNWVLFYVHRFWRLTPSYMFVVLFSIHLKGFLTEAPNWNTQFTDQYCNKYWWTNLLYINNFYPVDSSKGSCIGWSWYLANDMQFFVITPFLIIPLFKVGWRGVVLTLGLLLECTVITAFIHAYWDIDPLAIFKLLTNPLAVAEFGKSANEYMRYVYIKPYCRIQVYLVGFLVGYFMHRYSNTKARTPGWITTLLGWSVAAVVAMLLVYGPHKSILPGAEEWNDAENVLFGTFQRFLWGLVLAWVTYACHYGAGGVVQRFLSARFWIPLSRLTYNVYLIHIIILTLMIYGAQGNIHYDLYTGTYYFLACVVLSYGAAYILSVVIEFPCANLEELIIKYIRKARKRGE